VLPDARIHWKDAAVGATLTSVLFLVGKLLIGLYLAKSDVASVYGGAASIIIILSWVYYTAIILYYGAEFTKVYAIKAGHGIHVSNNAVFIIKREAKELPEWRLSSTEKLLHTPETEKPEQEDKDKAGSGQQQ
jgi:membrane protein